MEKIVYIIFNQIRAHSKKFSDLSRPFTNPENLGEIERLYGER